MSGYTVKTIMNTNTHLYKKPTYLAAFTTKKLLLYSVQKARDRKIFFNNNNVASSIPFQTIKQSI